MPAFERIPSIEEFLQRPQLKRVSEQYGRVIVTAAARHAAESLRSSMMSGDSAPASQDDAACWMETRVLASLSADASASLRPVINATGVIIHTNLGRAPLFATALERIATIWSSYCNLEYDLTTGSRGH